MRRGRPPKNFDQGLLFKEGSKAHGQGPLTKKKEQMMAWFMSFLFRRASGASFIYCDLNAGDGFNWKAGIKGTPRLAVDHFEREHMVKFEAYFIDKRRLALKRLEKTIAPDHRCRLLAMDNGEFLMDVLPKLVNSETRGLLLCDPNGPAGAPFLELIDTLRRYQRFDLLMYWPAAEFKRLLGFKDKPEADRSKLPKSLLPSAWKRTPPKLRDFMNNCERGHWYVTHLGKIQRFVICGTHDPWVTTADGQKKTLAFDRIGIHDIGSDFGRNLLRLADDPKVKK